ncbi:uncharacterized protein [Callorhinus ursinus]|uniref:uncharacterized protein n=1 Tax=Callorhinus ursinus TaxID=34884 RepID=UPI003CD0027D
MSPSCSLLGGSTEDVPLVWGQRPEPPAGGTGAGLLALPESAPIWGNPPGSWFSCPCSLLLPWRPRSAGLPSPTPSPPRPPLTRPSLPSHSPPTATEGPGTRTPTLCPPGRGRLVPPQGGGRPAAPLPPWPAWPPGEELQEPVFLEPPARRLRKGPAAGAPANSPTPDGPAPALVPRGAKGPALLLCPSRYLVGRVRSAIKCTWTVARGAAPGLFISPGPGRATRGRGLLSFCRARSAWNHRTGSSCFCRAVPWPVSGELWGLRPGDGRRCGEAPRLAPRAVGGPQAPPPRGFLPPLPQPAWKPHCFGKGRSDHGVLAVKNGPWWRSLVGLVGAATPSLPSENLTGSRLCGPPPSPGVRTALGQAGLPWCACPLPPQVTSICGNRHGAGPRKTRGLGRESHSLSPAFPKGKTASEKT